MTTASFTYVTGRSQNDGVSVVAASPGWRSTTYLVDCRLSCRCAGIMERSLIIMNDVYEIDGKSHLDFIYLVVFSLYIICNRSHQICRRHSLLFILPQKFGVCLKPNRRHHQLHSLHDLQTQLQHTELSLSCAGDSICRV